MKKKQETELVKKQEMTPEENQKKIEKSKRILSCADYFINEDEKIKELNTLYSSDKDDEVSKKRKGELATELSYAFNFENGIIVANLSHNKYSSALARMRQRLINDYDCKDSLELMIVDSIVASYWRAMRHERLSNLLCEEKDGGWSFNQQKINLLKEVNRGLELANRQMSNSIILLKELKQPKLNIKVTAENAFIAQNQQVNVDKKNNEA